MYDGVSLKFMSKDNGVSQASLSIARILDRLDTGEYVILLVKPGRGNEHYISLEISRKEQIDRRTIGKGEKVIDID